MRILITGTTGESMPPPYGGIPKVSLLYARAWKSQGHELAVSFVYRPKDADDLGASAAYYFEYASRPNKFIKLIFLLRYFFESPSLYVSLLKDYYAIYPRLNAEVLLYPAYGVFVETVIQDFKPDVILAEAALIKSFMVGKVAALHGIPFAIDTYAEVRDLQMGVNKNLTEPMRKKYWDTFLQPPALIMAMSNCADGVLSYVPHKVKVFYDTCDFTLAQEKTDETREEMRTSFGLPRDAFVVGAVGAFSPRKGHDHLIEAVAKLVKEGHTVAAAICGGGDSSKWQSLAKELGVEKNIYFFSRLSEKDLVRLHRSLDAYTNLSNTPRSCGLDLALLEGMAVGLPIIVYDNGALPESVPHGENGFVVKTNDVSGVAEAIRKLANVTPEQRQSMGLKSAEIASKTDINKTSVIKINWLKEIVTNKN